MSIASLDGASRRADSATGAALFVFVLALVPAKQVLKWVPLSITPATVIALGLGLWWLCAQLTSTLGMAKGRSQVRTAVFVYVVSLLATYGYGTYRYLPAYEMKLADHSLVVILGLVGVPLIIIDGIRSRERLDALVKAIVIAMTVVAAIGILQFLFKIDLTTYLHIPFLRSATEESSKLWERGDFNRVASTTAHPIEFGVACAMILPLAVHYGFSAQRQNLTSWRWWLCSGLLAVGVLFSISRSAFVGLAASAVVLFMGWPRKRRITMMIVAVVFVAVARAAVPKLIGTIYGLFANFGVDTSVSFRTHDYAPAFAEIEQHLWFGRGVGTWYSPEHLTFDNQYLLTLLEAGVIGLLAFVVLFVVVLVALIRARLISSDPDLKDLALTVVACIAVPVLGSATFDETSFATITGMTFLLVGVAGAIQRICAAEENERQVSVVVHS